MRTVTIVDQNDPRATYRYSAEPTDYVLGVQYVLEATERIMRVRRLRPTGYYVPDAVDDRGETRHPSQFRAELFGLRGPSIGPRPAPWSTSTGGTSTT